MQYYDKIGQNLKTLPQPGLQCWRWGLKGSTLIYVGLALKGMTSSILPKKLFFLCEDVKMIRACVCVGWRDEVKSFFFQKKLKFR